MQLAATCVLCGLTAVSMNVDLKTEYERSMKMQVSRNAYQYSLWMVVMFICSGTNVFPRMQLHCTHEITLFCVFTLYCVVAKR